MFPCIYLILIFLMHAVTSTEQTTELEPSAITKTPSEIPHTFSRVVSEPYSKLRDKIVHKSNRFSTRGYIADSPNYRNWRQPSPYEANQNAHQSAKPSISPHNRFERRAHYHHRRGHQRLHSFGCQNRTIDKNIQSSEGATMNIWNKFIKFIITNSTISNKNSTVEKKQISNSKNTSQRSINLDSSSDASTELINYDSTVIDDTTTSASIETINYSSTIDDTTTSASTEIIDNNSTIDITTTMTSVHTNTTLAPTTAQNKVLDLILHPHIHKQYPQYEIKMKYYMAVLLVADKSFMDFHRNTDYDTYILTVMNMAAELLHDLTLGVRVELTLARTIYLEDDSRQFEVDCEITSCLKNFCRWTQKINPRDTTHPSHHDVAILVTRYSRKENNKSGKLGASHLGAACVACKSCVVVQDTGLLLGISIAQQLGRLLGAPDDDGLEGRCPPEASGNTTLFQHVMAPTPRYCPVVWSQCSRNAVVIFFRQGLGTCLQDEPPKTVLAFPGILPGVMYDANYQCHLVMPGSRACYVGSVQFCSNLYCQCGTKECVDKGQRPAQGTFCGSDKWCFNGECVHSGERPGSVSGGWGSWLSWEACSRTCGGGVRRARRSCDSPAPTAGGRYCAGEAIRHHTCNTQPCNQTESSFRAVQCAAFDNVTISGVHHQWSPLAAPAQDTCGLYCKTEKDLKVRLRPRVIDGTACRQGTNDVCIDGVCTRVGCDWVIGSNTIDDRCGACGGDGSHCHLVQAWYNTSSNKNIGFKSITVIPIGSRKIKIHEVCSSGNHLALSSVPLTNEKEEYFIVGNDNSSSEEEFPIKSIVGIYSHIRPAGDVILIEGPLPVSLRVHVNLKGELAPIHYSYMDIHVVEHTEYAVTEPMQRLHRNPFMERNNPLHWKRYQWEHIEWSRCSARCEVGTSLCTPHCVSGWFGRVSDSYCDPSKKPQPRVRVCNERLCAVRWRTGPWCACVKSMQWRAVQCVREARSYSSAHTVVDARCCDGAPPQSVRPCNIGGQTLGSCVTNQSEVFELNKIEPNNNPLTTVYYIAMLDPAKRSQSQELTGGPYIKRRHNDENDLKSIETTMAPRTKEMQQSAKVESSDYSLPYQEDGETTGDDIETVMYSTSSLLEPQLTPQKPITSAIFDLFSTGNSNKTDDLDAILSNNDLTQSLSKHEPREKLDIEMTDNIMQSSSTEALSTHSIDYVTPKLINDHSKLRLFEKRKPRLLELKNRLFSRSKNKREILKHAEVLQNTNCTNTSKCASVISKINNADHNSTYLIFKLANGIITKINNIFNNTDKINLIFRDIKPEIMDGRDKVINTHNTLNSSLFKKICTSTNQKKNKYNKTYFRDYPKNKFANARAKLPSSNHFTEGPIDFRSKIQHSNEFVTKMPLKILKSVITVDGFESKLDREHNSNVIKQLDWLRNFTTAMIIPKCSAPSANMNNSEKMVLTRRHKTTTERVLRDCYRNISRNAGETQTINLDVKGSGVTIQSLFNVINIYCVDCKYKNINGSNKVISVFNDFIIKNQSIEDNTMDGYATPGNALQELFFETHESNHKEYVEYTTEALHSSTQTPSFVEITLLPLSKRNRDHSKLFRKYKRLFRNINNKHVLNNTNSINYQSP